MGWSSSWHDHHKTRCNCSVAPRGTSGERFDRKTSRIEPLNLQRGCLLPLFLWTEHYPQFRLAFRAIPKALPDCPEMPVGACFLQYTGLTLGAQVALLQSP